MPTDYDVDFVRWLNEQAALLRGREFAALDVDNLAEEIESLARSEATELRGRVSRLMAHLLMWEYRTMQRNPAWYVAITEERSFIPGTLDDAPSLAALLDDARWLETAWIAARRDAAKDTGMGALPDGVLPDVMPWTLEQILAPGFFPGIPYA